MDALIQNTIRKNFDTLAELFGGDLDRLPEASKSESAGFMDAHFDRLYKDDAGRVVIGLAHYYEMNGDLVPDPSMEVRIDRTAKTAEALSFQDAQNYHEVYDGERPSIARQHSLNTFLSMWLNNMKSQGHRFREAA